ncbi:hypothetical protein NL676_008656 [Syzygium grande]|nr:hypothetical protein NL676_008656 [Syzygium grande]
MRLRITDNSPLFSPSPFLFPPTLAPLSPSLGSPPATTMPPAIAPHHRLPASCHRPPPATHCPPSTSSSLSLGRHCLPCPSSRPPLSPSPGSPGGGQGFARGREFCSDHTWPEPASGSRGLSTLFKAP